jgi:multicomponent Na+:H+ antiporter subunit A
MKHAEATSSTGGTRLLGNLWPAILPLALFVFFASLLGRISSGEVVTASFPWVASLGVNLAFHVDGLALLFALIISGIGLLVVIYAGGYLAGDRNLQRFYVIVQLFMLAMLGVVTSGNLILLFIFWELTSITSYLLIGYTHDKPEARAAALQALLVTGSGGLAMLAGLVLLGIAGGSLELAALLSQGDAIRAHALYAPALVLILLGAFTKSAQVPFHFWLPGAMAAPTPVSAYLHSATMVKAGVYLLARLSPVLGGTALWQGLLLGVGGATMLIGAYLALRHTDLKRILAYSTVSALGTLVFLLGVGTPLAVKGALVYLLGHALYKGALFMVAGTIDHETGTRDITRLGGLRRAMPLTALAATVSTLSMAGLPPLTGFVGKEIVYDSTLHGTWPALLTGVALVTNIMTVAAAGMAAFKPFYAPQPEDAPDGAHEGPWSMWIGPLTLASLSLIFGLLIGRVGNAIIGPALSAVLNTPTTAKLALWHGFNVVLLLSLITLAAGVLVYRYRETLAFPAAIRRGLDWLSPAALYERSLGSLLSVAKAQTRVLQNGLLRYYLLVIISTTIALVGIAWLRGKPQIIRPEYGNLWLHEIVLAAVILLAALAILRARSRLASIAALGVVGFGVAMIFLLFSAPDLAMTQASVETLTVILFVLVVYRLPRYEGISRISSRVRDAAIALGMGGLMTALVLMAISTPGESRLAGYFTANSLELAKGRNIVNVILVDFRGFDTLGEITVLAAAALGVYALLKLRGARDEPRE